MKEEIEPVCEACGGYGYTIEIEAECCNCPTENNDCCNVPVPVQVQVKCFCNDIKPKSMTAKEQKIKEAYGRHYELVKKYIDNEGWCTQLDYSSGEEVKNHPHLNEMGFKKDDGLLDTGYFSEENKHKWRPKSLQGIENNNGWIRIESEEDLPKRDGLFYLFGEGGLGMGRFCELQNIFKTFNGNIYTDVTHYQPIVKPEPPIY